MDTSRHQNKPISVLKMEDIAKTNMRRCRGGDAEILHRYLNILEDIAKILEDIAKILEDNANILEDIAKKNMRRC